ncbi:hypothetical protein [Demequina maris]|uniref:hypothetical protein n=1 Tax=Demequina maris TaxID=1638982 RepID=UPI0007827250|nr:hypothetical protein [Demequina maris]
MSGEQRRFRRAIVHIGTERTGSTTIQGALAHNRRRLREQGVLVPRSLGREIHARLSVILQSVDPATDAFAQGALRGLGCTLEEAKVKVPALFEEEIARYPDAHTLVLTAEQFHSRFATQESKQALADFVHRYADEVTVIAYLRPQHDLAKSIYNYRIGRGNAIPNRVFPKLTDRNRHYYDYLGLIRGYEEAFGPGSVVPVVFDPRSFPEGDVVRDFHARAGLPAEGFTFIKTLNASIRSARALEFTRLLNNVQRPSVGEPREASRKPWLMDVLRRDDADRFLVDGRKAAAFQEQFDADNEELRAAYFPEREVLFRAPDEDERPTKVTREDMVTLGGEAYFRLRDVLLEERARRLLAESRLARYRFRLDEARDLALQAAAVTPRDGGATIAIARHLARLKAKPAAVRLLDAWIDAHEGERFTDTAIRLRDQYR